MLANDTTKVNIISYVYSQSTLIFSFTTNMQFALTINSLKQVFNVLKTSKVDKLLEVVKQCW